MYTSYSFLILYLKNDQATQRRKSTLPPLTYHHMTGKWRVELDTIKDRKD